jgi:hypothetical protein
MIIRAENRAIRAAANAEASGMKDALQSQTVYLCDMSDTSLFLIRYEKLDFASADPASAGVGRVCARCVPDSVVRDGIGRSLAGTGLR